MIQKFIELRASIKDRQKWMAAYDDLAPGLIAVAEGIFSMENRPQHWVRFQTHAFNGNLITWIGEQLLDQLDHALAEKLDLRIVLGRLLEDDMGL
jgi:hypothetical protein